MRLPVLRLPAPHSLSLPAKEADTDLTGNSQSRPRLLPVPLRAAAGAWEASFLLVPFLGGFASLASPHPPLWPPPLPPQNPPAPKRSTYRPAHLFSAAGNCLLHQALCACRSTHIVRHWPQLSNTRPQATVNSFTSTHPPLPFPVNEPPRNPSPRRPLAIGFVFLLFSFLPLSLFFASFPSCEHNLDTAA